MPVKCKVYYRGYLAFSFWNLSTWDWECSSKSKFLSITSNHNQFGSWNMKTQTKVLIQHKDSIENFRIDNLPLPKRVVLKFLVLASSSARAEVTALTRSNPGPYTNFIPHVGKDRVLQLRERVISNWFSYTVYIIHWLFTTCMSDSSREQELLCTL